ncbi:MAG: prephenate dehydratase [Dehalococcoidia bacterium]|nr:MAG: prephenate dehydratase [Dehalococcoidia bacterium]
MIKISIQGTRGSYHDIVARKEFPDDSEIIESDTIHQVFEDVKKGIVDYGVIAIENSIYGSFLENYDLLMKYDTKIISERYLKIVLDLLVLPGVGMADIEQVYSHPMAMTEAHHFLEKHPSMVRIETEDTAGSVRMIKEKNLTNAAAIGSNLAAEIYGMRILSRGIGIKNNYTRFLIIAKDTSYLEDADKTSLVIQAKNMPGSLYHCLKCFADEDINLSKIESRPVIGRTWDYNFYLDFEKGLNATETQRALKELDKVASMVKIMGSYKKSPLTHE